MYDENASELQEQQHKQCCISTIELLLQLFICFKENDHLACGINYYFAESQEKKEPLSHFDLQLSINGHILVHVDSLVAFINVRDVGRVDQFEEVGLFVNIFRLLLQRLTFLQIFERSADYSVQYK